MHFTAHNVVLADGTETKPGSIPVAKYPWILAAKRCLGVLYPQGYEGLRSADLGCLEGGYSVELARLGFGEVVGVEVRKANFDKCRFVKERLALPNLTFVNDDVWNLERHGIFDVIFCCGLLYHLGVGLRVSARWRRISVVDDRKALGQNNRAENSHQPLRQRERRMKRFKSPGSAQRFRSIHAAVYNVFNIQRHLTSRRTLRVFRDQAMLTWRQATVAA